MKLGVAGRAQLPRCGARQGRGQGVAQQVLSQGAGIVADLESHRFPPSCFSTGAGRRTWRRMMMPLFIFAPSRPAGACCSLAGALATPSSPPPRARLDLMRPTCGVCRPWSLADRPAGLAAGTAWSGLDKAGERGHTAMLQTPNRRGRPSPLRPAPPPPAVLHVAPPPPPAPRPSIPGRDGRVHAPVFALDG